jgi:hypothetical protein|tara:strand:+ start:475 stop:1245 length:771 start_codon:yes stop_codon:yes gene_type:complete
MSTIESDAVTAATGTNTALSLRGKGTGKVALGDAALLVPDADGAAGQILTTNGSLALTFAATPGSSGNVLTSNGSAWTSAAAAGGAWAVKSSGSHSGTSLEITGLAKTTKIILTKYYQNGTDGLKGAFSSNNGSSWDNGTNAYMEDKLSWYNQDTNYNYSMGRTEISLMGYIFPGELTVNDRGYMELNILEPQASEYTLIDNYFVGASVGTPGDNGTGEIGMVHCIAHHLTGAAQNGFRISASTTFTCDYTVLELN